MSTITEMLAALGSPDPAVRVPAEAAVSQAKESDLAGFILAVLTEFQDDTKPPFVRNMAGTLLKNAVAPSLREVAARQALEEKWKQLPAPVRQQVKAQVLATLGSRERDVRNVAANIVGSLSRIELPAGEWPNLITLLVTGAQSGAEQHQEAALTALGYICEEGQDYEGGPDASPLHGHAQAMLTAIVNCMSSANEDIKYSATRALCNAMDYISNNMENQQQRDFLIEALCSTASACANVRTREMAMEALVRVADLYYSYLPSYIQRLFELTNNAIFNDAEEVGLQAMLFWLAICETERDHVEDDDAASSLGYATQGMPIIVDICLKTMVKQSDMVDDDDDWNLSAAGGKLLQTLAEAVGQPIHKPVMTFVFANINSGNWRERDAALLAFGCVLGSASDAAAEALQDTVAQAVPGLLAYLRDTEEHVADTAAWVTSVVCEHYVDVFLNQPAQLQALMNIVGPLLVNPEPRVARRACTIVNNIALAFDEEEDQQTNELSPFYADIVQNLLSGIDNGSTVEYKSTSQETLNAVVDAAAADCLGILAALVPQLLTRLGANVRQLIACGGYNEDLESMVGLLCGAVSALARKLVQGYVQFLPASMEIVLALIGMQVDYVQDEALTAIGAIAYSCRDHMEPYLVQIVPYVFRCLQNYDEPDVQSIVVAAIGDLTLACSGLMKPYASDIMNALYANTVDPNVDREVKVTFLSCFSDVIMNVLDAQSVMPYMGTLMPLLESLFELSCQIDIRGDPEGEDYVMSLWEGTASVYTAIVQTFRGDEVQMILPYLTGILKFSLHAASHANDFTETVVAALTVLGDMANVLREASPQIRQQGKTALFSPQAQEIFAAAQKNPNMSKEDKKSLRWILTQLNKLQAS